MKMLSSLKTAQKQFNVYNVWNVLKIVCNLDIDLQSKKEIDYSTVTTISLILSYAKLCYGAELWHAMLSCDMLCYVVLFYAMLSFKNCK